MKADISHIHKTSGNEALTYNKQVTYSVQIRPIDIETKKFQHCVVSHKSIWQTSSTCITYAKAEKGHRYYHILMQKDVERKSTGHAKEKYLAWNINHLTKKRVQIMPATIRTRPIKYKLITTCIKHNRIKEPFAFARKNKPMSKL